MPDQVNNRRSLSIYLLLSLSAWVYIWLRAVFIPFQSDEAATFFMYVQTGNFLPPFSIAEANNHILNSILTWIAFQFFGSSPIALRLPNILAAPVYFYFTYKLARQMQWPLAKWGFIILSIGTHFLLEFFSYSRGYGLSLALMAGALYELILVINKIRLKSVVLASLYTVLATAANLNLIFTSITIFLFLLALLLYNSKSLSKKIVLTGLLTVLLAGGLSTVYFIEFSFQIRQAAGFYYGSPAGFFPVTISSLASMISGRFNIFLEIFAVTAFVITAALTIQGVVMKKINPQLLFRHSIFFSILLTSWIGALLLNHFLQVNYQEDRAAIYLIPVFYGMVFFGLASLYHAIKRYALIAFIPFIFILAFSISQISMTKSVYGNSQQAPIEFFQFIRQKSEVMEFPPVVSSYQARSQVWAFMNYRSGGYLNPLLDVDFPNKSADYLIHELPLPDSLSGSFELIITDQNTRTALFRNSGLPDFRLYRSVNIENEVNIENFYSQLIQLNADSLRGRSLRLEADLTIESPEVPLEAALVVEVFDSHRINLSYEAIDLDQLRHAWNQPDQLFHHVFLIHNIQQESESVIFYFWNKEKVPVKILEGKISAKISGVD